MRVLSLSFVLLAWMSSTSFGQPSQQMWEVSPDGKTFALLGVRTKCFFEQVPYTYTVKVPVTSTIEVEVDGKAVTKVITTYQEETRTGTRTVCKSVCETYGITIDPQTVEAFETDGRKIALDDLKKRLKKPTLVVMADNGGMLPDYYAAVYKPGTIIIGKAGQLSLPAAPVVPGPPPGTLPQPVPTPRVVPVPQPKAAPPATSSREQTRSLVRPVSHQVAIDESVRESRRLPASPPPQLVFATREGADLVKIRQFTETKTEAEITVKANDSSVSPDKQVKVSRTTRHSETTPLAWNAIRVSTADGADVPTDRAKERLGSGETTMLLSADGKLVDAFWLQNIRPTVLVIRGVILPPVMAYGQGGYGMPMPMAPATVAPAAPGAPPIAPPRAIPKETEPRPVQPTPKPEKT